MPDLQEIILNSRKLVFFGGAGVSTESGIPDFRSASGRYRAGNAYGVSAETLLSYSFFLAHPDIFYRYYRENLICPKARPNAAHKALAALEARGTLHAIITQNIDGLHQAAGSSAFLSCTAPSTKTTVCSAERSTRCLTFCLKTPSSPFAVYVAALSGRMWCSTKNP